MGAGDSAALEAQRAEGALLALRDEERELERRARDFGIGAASERQLARTLDLLTVHGYSVLADRIWPGRKKAQIDFIVVGSGGVFFIDAKCWRDVSVIGQGNEKRILRGQADETEKFEAFADLANRAECVLSDRLGLVSGEVHALAVFTHRGGLRERVMGVDLLCERDCVATLLRRGDRLTAEWVARVVAAVEDLFPPARLADDPYAVVIQNPARRAAEPPALLSPAEINDLTLTAKLAEPIEEWMVFLDPAQSKVVRRSFNGPCRIRGAAGTGKTVVGLHRAAYLARNVPGRVLVTTFVRTLSDVLESQLTRLAPEVVGRVDFRGVHEFALDVLKRAGEKSRLDRTKADAALRRVWAQHSARLFGGREHDRRFWAEEIAQVIKGRGLTTLEEYLACARPGRARPPSPGQRTAGWALYELYQAELRREGVRDFADVILAADALLAAERMRDYSAVIIDEAQDLTCAMVRMLHRLVGDAPDGLTLIGDGQQSIYPGGYTLAEAGISLVGRGVVLGTNYRNTVEIVEFAQPLVAGDRFMDLEGGDAAGDRSTVARHGAAPTSASVRGDRERDAVMVARVTELLARPGIRGGDVGVLARYRRQVEDAVRALRASGIPVVDLESWRGESGDRVKVGTVKRAKGLEFKEVLVLGVARGELGRRRSGERTDAEVLASRELYVAMTRARDGLWVAVE